MDQAELFRFLSLPLKHAVRSVEEGSAPEPLVRAWRESRRRLGVQVFALPDWVRVAMHPRITRSRLRILREKSVGFERAVDVTGGIGVTSIILASAYKRVIVFERDPLRAAFLGKNLALHGVRNARLIVDDSTKEKYVGLIRRADVVFLDPERPVHAAARSVEEGQPPASAFSMARVLVEDVSPLIPYARLREAYPGWLFHAFPEGLRHARTAVLHGVEGDVIVGTEETLLEGAYEEPIVKPLEELAMQARPGVLLCEASMSLRWAGLLRGEWYGDARRTLRVVETPEECGAFMLARRILMTGDEESIQSYLREHPGRVKLKYHLPSDAYHAEQARFATRGENTYALYKAGEEFILTTA